MADNGDSVLRVWIEPGCIVCNACESSCPEVFHVEPAGSTVRQDALDAEVLKTRAASIREAAAGCPVEVIKFETSPRAI